MTDPIAERRYAELEAGHDSRRAATVRRGPVSLIAVVLGIVLLVGATAAVDLRRLATPAGTAQSWTGAAVFGDCTTFRRLTVDAPAGDAACRDLRAAGEPYRERPDQVQIEVRSTEVDGDRARAVVQVVLPPDLDSRSVPLELRRVDGRWKVELTRPACDVLPCP